MADRKLSPEEVEALGLNRSRKLSPEEVSTLGLNDPAPKPLPEVGAGETFVRRAWDAFPLARPVWNIAGTMADKAAELTMPPPVRLTDKAKSEAGERGIPVSEPKAPGFWDSYRSVRDQNNLRMDAGSGQNPWAGRAGTAFGVGASFFAPLPKVAVGAGSLGRIGSALLTGAGYGGLFGATHGPADLAGGDTEQFARDVVGVDGLSRTSDDWKKGNKYQALLDFFGSGAIGGAALGGGLATATEAAAPTASRAARGTAISQGRKAIQGNSDIAAATREPLSDQAVAGVLDAGGIKPGASVSGTYTRIAGLAEQEGKVYADIVEQLRNAGVRGPKVEELADKMMERYRQEYANSGANKAVARAFKKEANNLREISKPIPSGESPPPGAVEGSAEGPASTTLRVDQAENVKRTLQRDARFDRLNNSPTDEAKQELSSMVRQANEDAISAAGQRAGEGSAVRELANRFVPTKQKLANLLEARTFAERAASKASQHSGGLGMKDLLHGSLMADPTQKFAAALASKALGGGRMASTVSAGANALSKGLASGELASSAGGLAKMTAPVASRPGGVMTSPALADSFLHAVTMDPSVLGRYGPVIAREQTPAARLAMTQALIQTDPEFAQLFAGLKQRLMSGGSAPEARRGP